MAGIVRGSVGGACINNFTFLSTILTSFYKPSLPPPSSPSPNVSLPLIILSVTHTSQETTNMHNFEALLLPPAPSLFLFPPITQGFFTICWNQCTAGLFLILVFPPKNRWFYSRFFPFSFIPAEAVFSSIFARFEPIPFCGGGYTEKWTKF